MMQYGRYLLISSSQPGGQAANLQGVWNDKVYAMWDSKYTININAEMNYWPSLVGNLVENQEPLLSMIRDLSETGTKTAQRMYGLNECMAVKVGWPTIILTYGVLLDLSTVRHGECSPRVVPG